MKKIIIEILNDYLNIMETIMFGIKDLLLIPFCVPILAGALPRCTSL